MTHPARVVMLVNNDWRIDSRVMREAATLAAAGHEVHVISRNGQVAPAVETQGGVTIHNLPLVAQQPRLARLSGLFRLHWGVIRAGRALPRAGAVHARATGEALRSLLVLVTAAVFLPVLLPVALMLLVARRHLRAKQEHMRLEGTTDDWRWRLLHACHRILVNGPKQWLLPEHVRYLNEFGLDAEPLARSLQPQVVHAHDLVTLSTGYSVAQATSSLLVYDAHELETHTNYWGLAPATHDWIAIYESILIRRAEAVVTVCDSIADWLRDHYGISRPAVVLNSPDLQPIEGRRFTKRSLREQLELSREEPLAVYVGAVSVDRGLVQCVQATALLPELHFAFVGHRYSATEAEMRAAATRLGIQNRVHFVDPVPSHEVSGFVASADCSVIAIQNVCLSYYFCFPNKLLESVISGLPVAAARLVELERFLDRFQVGLTMDETDPASIAQAIGRILQDPAAYKPGPATLRTIGAEYGWSSQQAKLLDMYRQLDGAAASLRPLCAHEGA